MSTYIDEIAARVREEMGDAGLAADAPSGLITLYALLVKLRGTDITAEDVHDAWSTWKSLSRESHESVVTFTALDRATQAKDEPYAAVLRRVARRRWPGSLM